MPRVAALAGALSAILFAAAAARADGTDACIQAAEKSQVERKAGHLGAARELLVSCSADACPALIRSDCARWLGEVEAATPTVVLRATDGAGEDVNDADVRVDGAPRPHALDGRAIPLDPGPHRLRVERRGLTIEREVVVREGERDRVIAVRLAPPVKPTARGVPRGAWILMGAGAAVMAAGAILWIDGLEDRSRLFTECAPNCTPQRIDDARNKLIAGDIVFGVGAAVGIGGIVWALAGSSRRAPASALAAGPLPGGGALGFTTSF
jgi:hypothetical protein